MIALVTEPGVIGRLLAPLERRGDDARAGPWAGAVRGSASRAAAGQGAEEPRGANEPPRWNGPASPPAGGGERARGGGGMLLRDGVRAHGGRLQRTGTGREWADGRVPEGSRRGRKPLSRGRGGV